MPNVLVQKDYLEDIADSIRGKNGLSETYTPGEMAGAIDRLAVGGSVTSVAVANATDGGLTISGSPITVDGTIIIGHSNVLSSAEDIQAVYPITIDKNGHIASYDTAIDVADKQYVIDAISNIPNASASARGLVSTGAQIFAGQKTFNAKPIIASSDQYPEIIFKKQSDSNLAGTITINCGESNANSNQLYFNVYHRAGGVNDNTYRDTYQFPITGSDNASHTYKIITTNNLSDIPDASNAGRGLVSTETQMFNGQKIFVDYPRVASNAQYPTLHFQPTYYTGTSWLKPACVYVDFGGASTISKSNWCFRSYIPNSTSDTGTQSNYVQYQLPAVTSSDSQGSYNIITTKNIADIPDASDTVRGLVGTGTQSFAGNKTFIGTVATGGSDKYPGINLKANNDTNIVGTVFVDTGSATANTYNNTRLGIQIYAAASANGARSSYVEEYHLPYTTNGITSHQYYDILTTKNVKSVVKKYENIVVPSSGYVLLGSLTNHGLPSASANGSHVLGIYFAGWGAPNPTAVSLGSNDTDLYLIGPAGTYTYVRIRVTYFE